MATHVSDEQNPSAFDPLCLSAGRSFLVGRGSGCDLHLDDPAVSQVHFRLFMDLNRLYLIDAASRWGTFVNNHRVHHCELFSGDRIRAGNSLLLVQYTLSPLFCRHTAWD